ncbi:kremen protein 2-like [Littorina saxatilis]|uniref:kremen protein 2-like n=1 Tax=Littorina saxatilis TaxID=31220 RepID=UPI0038B69EB4
MRGLFCQGMSSFEVMLILGMLHPLGALVVKFIGCMTETKVAKEVLQMEMLQEKPTKEEKERIDILVRSRGPFATMPVGTFSGMTVQVCVQRCWMARNHYAAIKNANRCYCAKSLGSSMMKVNSTLCYERCSGNCRQRCGGRMALSVYETGYVQGSPSRPKYAGGE